MNKLCCIILLKDDVIIKVKENNKGGAYRMVEVYTLNSFAKAENGGNPAGVVLSAEELNENQMQKIAAEIGFSETAFVSMSNKADFKVRFFTPNGEVDLCGHATIAVFSFMAQKEIITKGIYTQETKAGILNVEIRDENIVMMNQTSPEFYNIIDKKEIAQSLNICQDNIVSQIPIQVVSTGIKDIFVPIKDIETLKNIKPNLNQIEEISRKYDVTGYHLFTLETENNSTAHCRNFAPLYGIPEESATGTSNGALSCYLYKYGKIKEEQLENLIFEQGYSMKKPSEILVELRVNGEAVIEVKVGGSAKINDKIEIDI